MDSKVYKNVLAWRGCEKLYLNERTRDVSLVFFSKEIVSVPAHKNILAAISPVFDAMFYGPNKQEAFIEFLQFFYRSEVTLSIENVSEVLDLCKRYLLDD